ncbi:MAG: ACP S-malonyltransferase, partial [Candidatus Adiutrix sp.]|nr:ACP S-malonyltransferase [Candidatus Adiutrix sp.]
ELFRLADDITERPITKLCFEGPADDLGKTANLQPAVLTVSLAALRKMKAAGHKPAFAAGHSLGEFGALVAAEVFTEAQALKLVAQRAVLMEEAAAKNPGAMLAVIGLAPDEVEGICELARNEGIVVAANFNTPEQIVISGEVRAVTAAGKYVKMKSGRAIPLPVSGGFHSELMATAGDKFAHILAETEFKTPICPVAPNSTAALTSDPAEIKARLLTQIVSPVKWTQTVAALAAAGADSFIEAWPKAYLGAMTKKYLGKDSPAEVTFQA